MGTDTIFPTDGSVAFRHRLRVYYEDTDAGGIVYHANYLRWFERARTDWLRAIGAPHRELAARHGIGFVVKDCRIDWLRPARLDDTVEVDMRVLDVKRASMRVLQCAWRVDDDGLRAEKLSEATLRIATIDQGSGRPVGMPGWLLARIQGDGPDAASTPTVPAA